MTVEELIDLLRPLPPTATIVFRHDDQEDYDDVDVFYDLGEVFIDIHGSE